MKRFTSVGIVTLFVLMAVATWAVMPSGTPASESQQTYPSMGKSTQSFTPEILKARDLIGMKVESPSNEHLGKIADVVLTADKKHVAYCALKFEGKYFAVPCAALNHTTGSKILILNKDQAALRAAQGFDKKNWPYMASAEFGPVSEKMYSAQPTELLAIPIADRRLSNMLNLKVRDNTEHRIGELRDVAIDFRGGDVVYGIVALGRPLPLTRAKLAAVPWGNIAIDPQGKIALLPVEKSTLQEIAFRSKDYPNLADSSFARRTYEHFNQPVPTDIYGYTAPGPTRPEMRASTTFDPARVTALRGTVQSIAVVREAEEGRELQITLKADDGRLLTVQLAPRGFLRKQAVLPAQGDQLQLRGCIVDRNGQNIFIASQIDAHGKTVLLRSDQGKPLWHRGMKSKGTERSMEPMH